MNLQTLKHQKKLSCTSANQQLSTVVNFSGGKHIVTREDLLKEKKNPKLTPHRQSPATS